MNFSSPIRDIKGSKYNHVSDVSHHYQQQFWKLKAQRMVIDLQNLNAENQKLQRKLRDKERIEQELRQTIIVYEDDWKKRSRRLITQRVSDKFQDVFEDKITSTNELSRLYKEIRVIKNTHEIQIKKLQEENKRLNKQLQESTFDNRKSQDNVQNLKIIGKLNEEIKQLKRKLTSSEESVVRLRDQKIRLMSDTEKYRRQIQQIKFRQKIAEKEEEDRLFNYQKRFQELSQVKFKKSSQISPIEEEDEEESPKTETPQQQPQKEENVLDILPQIGQIAEQILTSEKLREENEKKLKESQDQVQKLKRKVAELQKKVQNFEEKLKLQQGNLENEKFSNEVKRNKLEGDLMQARAQLSDVLRKLSPLLQKRRDIANSPKNIEKRASLSILQIFLKKYKIQAF